MHRPDRTRRRLAAILLAVAGASKPAAARTEEELPTTRAAIPTLGERVSASLDDRDVPRIEATTLLDAIRAEGWLHADARFLQMDFARREASARLSELVPQALPLDRRAAHLGLGQLAERALAALPDAHRRMLDAYADGVNARLRAEPGLPEYRLLRSAPEAWRPVDTILVQLAMARYLDGSASLDLERAPVHGALPAGWATFLTHRGGVLDQTVDGSHAPSAAGPDRALVERLAGSVPTTRRDQEAPTPPASGEVHPGSNAFAVAGSRTRDGRAIVGNDMHLAHSAPGFWYRVEMEWPGGRLMGLSLPGVPLVVQGTNGRVAWAFTNLTADLADLVRLEVDPDDPSRYRLGAGFEPFGERRIAIGPASGREEIVVRSTAFGPVLAEPLAGAPVAWRWSLAEDGGVDCGLFDLCLAGSLDDAISAAAAWRGPPQNVLVADELGDIGWTISGSLPQRARRTPVPVDASAAPEWDGLLATGDKPRIVRPASGILASANQLSIAPEGALAAILGGDEASGDRAQRLRSLLESRNDWTEPELHALQLDTHSARLLRWRPLAVDALARLDDEAARASGPRVDDATRTMVGEARRLLGEWNGRVEVESAPPVFLDRFRGALRRAIGTALRIPSDAISDDAVLRLAESAPEGSPFWPHALAEAARTALAGSFDAEGRPRLRGDENVLVMRHPAADAFGPLARLASMPPTPLPGHPTAVRVQTPSFGASQRSVVSPAHLEDAILVTPAGQAGLPSSPHFRSLHAPWVRGEPWPLRAGAPARRVEFVPNAERDEPNGGPSGG
ncbi:MAG: hypothetical protein RIS86_1867 [Planctomycetota bacterium]